MGKMTFLKPFKRVAQKILAATTLAAFMLGAGSFTALAGDGTPIFNNLPDDYPTLQVAKTGGTWGTSVSASPGETISLLVWDHNSVPDTIARNVQIKVNLPTVFANTHTPTASVSADNAATVTGSSTVNVGTSSKLQYVPGSAKFLRNVGGTMTIVSWPASVTNPDEVVTSGINVGDQKGCWADAQAVLLQVKIVGGTSAINTNKKVELVGGAGGFADSAKVSPNDEVAFRIFVENTGTAKGTNVRVIDTLDSRLTYSPGSSYMVEKIAGSDVKTIIPDSSIKFEGQKITYAFKDMEPKPDAAIYLYFKARVAGPDSFPVGDTILKNKATVTFDLVSKDTNEVAITVTKFPAPVITFSLRKEVTNRTLGDSKWYDEELASAAPGDTISYRLIAQDTGDTPATNVTLKDILPDGVSFLGNVKLFNKDYPTGTTIAGDAIVKAGYLFSSIINGSDNIQTIIFDAKITTDCLGTKTMINKAQIIYLGIVQAEDTAKVIISCVKGLIITKDALDASDMTYKNDIGIVKEGQIITYRVLVQNNGTVPLINVLTKDVLPSQVSYVNNSLAIDGEFMSDAVEVAYFSSGGTFLTNLLPGIGKTITFQVKVNECPPLGDIPLINTAFAKADGVTEISDTAKATVRVIKPGLPLI